MRYAKITIVGKLGTVEQVAHTLSLRTAPVVDVDQDVAAIQTLANQVRDIWQAWWNSTVGGAPIKSRFSPNVVYQEVRAAYLQLPGVGRRVVHGAGTKSEHVVYEYDKPEYLVPTQYAPMAATNQAGTGSSSLPWEVALGLSLDSGRRGPANRGRLYLPPLTTGVMGADGKFDPTIVQGIASSFATGVVQAINTTTGCDVHIASRYWNDSIPVASVRAGIVPDSQRRRRRNQAETYGASVATPLV